MSIFAELEIQYPPKIGEKKVITITGNVKRVDNSNSKKDDENYKSKTKEDQGFYDLIPTEDLDMKCSTWKLYFALKVVFTESAIISSYPPSLKYPSISLLASSISSAC